MKLGIFLVPLLLLNSAFAQIVVTVPRYGTEKDSLTITFDATQAGSAELLNYTGTVYAHTGVNTNLGNWQHVIGAWANNQNQPSLTRLDPNLYQLTIGHPRQFYSLTDTSEHIAALAFVFRSADGTKQTRPDIFVDLYQPGLNVVVERPLVSVQFGDPLRSPAFASVGDTVLVAISAAEIGTKVSIFMLAINNTQVAQTDSNHIDYDFVAVNYGVHEFRAIGIDTSGLADTSRFVIVVNPMIEDALVPLGTDNGINYIDNNTVTLALFAPNKKFVYLVGDCNDWKVNTTYFLKRQQTDTNNVIWWITLSGLTPGEEYAFQYLVDGELRIGDPYTEKVLDPSNDQSISSSTYPDLKPYPTGKTAEIVSVLQTNQSSYNWQTTNFQRPAKSDLVIYELLTRDFVTAHDYKTLIDTLSYLKNLGVNAVELMPIMEFEGNQSWGYNPSFHMALDKYYGSKNDFKRFVDSAHAKGIGVILDVVLNHAYGQSPLVRLYWDAANNRPTENSPWFNVSSPNTVYSFGYDFNHERKATQDFVDRVNRYWLKEYKIDGFRFDFTKGFTNTPGDGGSYDASRINILKRMADKVWLEDSTAYVILEHFAANDEEKTLSDYGMMLWGNLNYNYNEATMGYHDNNKSDFSWASYKTRGWTKPHLVAYMESHDEERLMYKNLQYGNSSGDYNVKNLSTALNRIKLAAAFFFTIPGPKMIWQFGELGYDVSIDNPCRVCNKPNKWEYYYDASRKNLYKVFAALTRLRQYDATKTTNFTLSVASSTKRITLSHPSMDLSVIGNFDVSALNCNPNFSRTGVWFDYFTGDSVNVTDPQMSILLEPGEFRIYTTVKLPTPEKGILIHAEKTQEVTVKEYSLRQNFPNPFNPSTTFSYDVPVESFVSLKIYNLLGKEVSTLVESIQQSGSYEASWDGRDKHDYAVSSGVYLARLQASHFTAVVKILLIK
ncbi:MAG: T9SS type A sorting domain-containing protein [Ignavibacteriales bacterium]|nr:T9SS type A sorting domain-containing protein [Ignavibacteriales bacterium]